MHDLLAHAKVVVAVAPTAGSPGTMTATAVDGSGFRRVHYTLLLGAMTSTSDVNAKVTECATSGGSYDDITSAALTEIADTGGGAVYTIDVPVNGAKPFQKVVVVVAHAASVNGVIAHLLEYYHGKPTQTAGESIRV